MSAESDFANSRARMDEAAERDRRAALFPDLVAALHRMVTDFGESDHGDPDTAQVLADARALLARAQPTEPQR